MKVWRWQTGASLAFTLSATLLALLAFGQRRPFLPGQTSDGHHQIEQACDACHSPFRGVRDRVCIDCHGAELEAAKDSHSADKFRDPRMFDMLTAIDATRCVTCHREHVPQLTRSMSVTQPPDFCQHCHAEIATERPSHQGFSANSCATTGCHRYHDNRALYEGFLVSHLDEPDTKTDARRPPRELGAFFATVQPARKRGLTRHEHDGNIEAATNTKLVSEWAASAHARNGTNCGGCHRDEGGQWSDHPDIEACEGCHAPEARGFRAGRHGMRIEQGLPALTPREARLAMKPESHGRELGCNSCHGAHAYDTRKAAVNSCRSCHDDEHTRAYMGSPHQLLWQKELDGELPPGSGVSCATCHLPRSTIQDAGRQRMGVEHNQNANLRPNDKFVRSVCLGCHGLSFALTALADGELVRRNFPKQPRRPLDTFEMVRRRAASKP